MFFTGLQAECLYPLCDSLACRSKLACNSLQLSNTVILDLRRAEDFEAEHILGARSSPLKNLTSKTGDIFDDPQALHVYWTNLILKFSDEAETIGWIASPLLVLCYDGEVSRLATSLLRAQGHEAYSVLGGFPAFLGKIGGVEC